MKLFLPKPGITKGGNGDKYFLIFTIPISTNNKSRCSDPYSYFSSVQLKQTHN